MDPVIGLNDPSGEPALNDGGPNRPDCCAGFESDWHPAPPIPATITITSITRFMATSYRLGTVDRDPGAAGAPAFPDAPGTNGAAPHGSPAGRFTGAGPSLRGAGLSDVSKLVVIFHPPVL